MTLTTYSQLKEQVAMWLGRPDYTTFIPDFISLAENRLNRILCDNVNLVCKVNLTFNSPDRPVPDDFNGMVSLVYPANPGGALRYMPASDFFNLPANGGVPQYFTISAGKISIWPGPSDNLTLTARYRIKLDALKLGPNWLMDNHADAYLFGALVEAADFIPDESRGPVWQGKFDRSMAEINKQAQDIAFGGPLQVKSCGGE